MRAHPSRPQLLDQAERYEVILVVLMHPHGPCRQHLQAMANLQFPFYNVVFHLQDSQTIRARHPMVYMWLTRLLASAWTLRNEEFKTHLRSVDVNTFKLDNHSW